jgi:alpha-tubulin suppressor-like RCC1 family protein
VAAVSCSWQHTLAVCTDGTVWTWGGNDNGQLGNGINDASWVPVQVQESQL